jgi:glycine/D-amino acid oxidase-like deaminating enzyme
MTPPADVAVIGGGIVGCAAAAFLVEAGVRVDVYERDEVASGASGRNSGVIQHPFDEVLTELHTDTLAIYRGLEGFELPDEPAGLMMLSEDAALLEPAVSEIAAECPELGPLLLEPREAQEAEPALAKGMWACRLETGWPVRPAAATKAFARRAHAAGARFHEGETAWPWVMNGRARGVLAGGVRRPADAVLVTAGPWTPEVIDTTRAWAPIMPVWGVVCEMEMDEPPRHVLEEAGVEAVVGGGQGTLFSLVNSDGQISIGSTFFAEAPDPAAWVPALKRGAERYVPGVGHSKVVGARACARPQSFDGRPLVGELPGNDGLWVAAGHGPWGISSGPATARIVTDALLSGSEVPASLSAARF